MSRSVRLMASVNALVAPSVAKKLRISVSQLVDAVISGLNRCARVGGTAARHACKARRAAVTPLLLPDVVELLLEVVGGPKFTNLTRPLGEQEALFVLQARRAGQHDVAVALDDRASASTNTLADQPSHRVEGLRGHALNVELVHDRDGSGEDQLRDGQVRAVHVHRDDLNALSVLLAQQGAVDDVLGPVLQKVENHPVTDVGQDAPRLAPDV